MPLVEILVPEFPDAVLAAPRRMVLKWYRAKGDAVHKGDDLVELLTEKANFVLQATCDGTLENIAMPEGTENIKVRQILGTMRVQLPYHPVVTARIRNPLSTTPRQSEIPSFLQSARNAFTHLWKVSAGWRGSANGNIAFVVVVIAAASGYALLSPSRWSLEPSRDHQKEPRKAAEEAKIASTETKIPQAIVQNVKTLARSEAAKAIQAMIDGKPSSTFAFVDTTIFNFCWFPSPESINRIEEVRARTATSLSGGQPLQYFDRLAAAGITTPLQAVGFIISDTKGYVYVDCFGRDMTPQATGRDNYYNLNGALLKVEPTQRTRADLAKVGNKPLALLAPWHLTGSNAKEVPVQEFTVVLSRHRFESITGISDNVAEFTYQIEPTETGRARGQQVALRNGSAAFRLYDDGWRIVGLNLTQSNR